MIDVHPVCNSVLIALNVGGGPLESGAKFVLAGWHILEYKPALRIRFSPYGLATG